MKILANILHQFSQKRSYGIGVLEDDVASVRGGFSEPLLLEERRASERVAISVPVWYRIKSGWSKWLLGKSVDYSETGIRLALPTGIKPGTEMSLKIKLPNAQQPMDMRGIVIWVAPAEERYGRDTVECGVAFKNIRNVQNKEKLIYLIANKLCKIGLQFTKHIIAEPVQTIEDLKACYSIVYRGYVARRYCLPNETAMHYHYHAFLPQSRAFTLKEKGKMLGTISIIVDSPCGLPMDTLFSRELDHLRGNGRKLAEVSLLAMAPGDKTKKIFSLTNFDKQVRLFRLFKIMYEYSRNVAGVTDLIIGVHPKHETLYKYLMFKAMGSVKSYPGARGNPALPLHLDLVAAEQECSSCLKSFFLADMAPKETLEGGLKMNAEIAHQFLCEDQKLWDNIPTASQNYLKKCYPGVAPHPFTPILNFFSK